MPIIQIIQKKFCFKLVVTLGLCLCDYYAHSQTLSATLNRDKILIGEQISLELKAEGLDLQQYHLKQWFNVADTFNSFEVLQRKTIDTIKVGSNTGFAQKIVLTSFDSGYWQIPSFNLVLESKLNNALINFSTNSLYVTVLPVIVDSLKDFHDIKGIETVETYTDWKLIIAIVLTLVIVFFAILWFKSKKQILPSKNSLFNEQPDQWALAQIDLLLQEQLLEKHDYNLFYIKLIQISKTYTDATLKMNSQFKTVDECTIMLKGRLGNEIIQTQYFQLLRLSNAVKFAKYIPNTQQNTDAVRTVVNMIHTLHKSPSNA